MPKVSIIIPVYNAEPYIEKCARSLFGQTLDDLEYIFVNDCTPDHSIEVMGRVLEDFPNRKHQVKVIHHTANCGVAITRQDGIHAATGEYIIHCDPDDWVELNMYDVLYQEAISKSADMVICDFYYHNNGSDVLSKQRPEDLSNITVLENITGRSRNLLHGNLWNKLIKATHYTKVKFPDVNYCEDVAVLFQILSNSLSIVYFPYSLYHYKIDTPGSLVKKYDIKSIESDIRLINYLKGLSKKEDIRYNDCIESMTTAIIYRAFIMSSLNNDEFQSSFISYKDNIWKNHYIGKIRRLLLQFALRGHYHISLLTYNFLINISKRIRHSLKL